MRHSITILLFLLLCACNNHQEEPSTPPVATAEENNIPAVISYEIINEYPHDVNAFTEGLEMHDGYMYESTGEYGSSDLRKTDIKTGKVLEKRKLADKYFGEGLTILNGKIYQLTYREGTGFVYDLKTMNLLHTFTFDNPEGWGMTNDGKSLIYDDGGNVLYYMDPNTFKIINKVPVTDEHGPVNNINELEYIKGYIYANVWQTFLILKIDPKTGKVVGRADLSDLPQKTGIVPMPGNANAPDVLNGIAYDSANNKIYITGKLWPKLFEVKLDN